MSASSRKEREPKPVVVKEKSWAASGPASLMMTIVAFAVLVKAR
jgi:hypothetical protein